MRITVDIEDDVLAELLKIIGGQENESGGGTGGH